MSHATGVVWLGAKPHNIIALMNNMRITFAVSALVLGLAPLAAAAPPCSVRSKVPASARTFAKVSDDSTWREFRSLGEVPQLELGNGMSAQFWQDKKKNSTVSIVEPGQDYWTYTRYCFDEEGQLEGVSYEIRTPLGWGHRAEGSVSGEAFDPSSQEFFRIKDGRQIVKPEGVDDAPAALQPALFLSVNQLPFAELLNVTTASNERAK
jgi:hypothetical protein